MAADDKPVDAAPMRSPAVKRSPKRRLKLVALGCGGLIAAPVLGFLVLTILIASGVIEPAPKKAEDEAVKPAASPPPATAPVDPERVARQKAENERKLADLLAGEKSLPREDVEGRLLFWNDIVRHAPNNSDYARRRNELKQEADGLSYYREHPELAGEITKLRWRLGGFNRVMIADLTIRNRGLSNLKDFFVSCDVKGPSGTTISQPQTIVYEVVKARSTRTLKNVAIGFMNAQASAANCTIKSASIL